MGRADGSRGVLALGAGDARVKIVSPYRPFPPESPAHRKLGAFDWVDALSMLRASARQSCRCQTFAITDVDTDLPGHSHRYVTTERRLMLWILEVSSAYLESEDFNQDTVMVSPDMLVVRDLREWFKADLGVIVRLAGKYQHRPLLNGVQWWRHAAKDRLIAFYRRVRAVAATLPKKTIRWGADTEALVQVLAPLRAGLMDRDGLSVYGVPTDGVLWSMNPDHMLPDRRAFVPSVSVVDFKFHRRKQLMRAYYDATIGVPA
jgi:hypothetical protein